jgi:hypothetical protein
MFRQRPRSIALCLVWLAAGAHAAAGQTTVVQRGDGSTATVTVQSDAGAGNTTLTNTVVIVGGDGTQPPPGGVPLNTVQFSLVGGVTGGVAGGVAEQQSGAAAGLGSLSSTPSAGPTPFPPRDQAQAVGTSRIRGRVIAADSGRPLRRATVRLASPGVRESRSATTDQDGRYEFTELAAASYSLSASRSGYVQMGYKQTRPNSASLPLALGDRQTLERIDIALPPGGVITGRVLDEYGEPVSDTFVTAQRQQFMNGTRRPVPAGAPSSSNDIGEFRIYGLAPGDYFVSANPRGGSPNPFETTNDRAGYAPTFYPSTTDVSAAQRVTVRAGDTVANIVVTLAPTRMARVSGLVIDTQGQPVRGGAVVVMPASGMVTMPLAPGMVRPDGTFTINAVAPGDYILRSVLNGVPNRQGAVTSMAMAAVTVSGTDLSNIVLQPQSPIFIKGRLTGDPATLAQVTPASVRLMATPLGSPMAAIGPAGPPQPLHDDLSFELSVYPGDYGVRAVPALPAGMVIKTVRLNGREVNRGFRVDAGATLDDLEVEVTTATARVAVASVNARNEAVASRDVVVFPQDESQWSLQLAGHGHEGRTDDQGHYQSPPLLPGAYYVALPDAMETGESADPEFLAALRPTAQRVTVGAGETGNLQLRVADR